jgi:hypothetical protein
VSTFTAAERELGERFSFEPPLVEVPLDDLARQMEEQHDKYAAAKSEADQAVAIADQERSKLDAIMAQYFVRQKASRT